MAAVALALPVWLAAQAELPDAPAKETVKKICGNCHEIDTVIGMRRTKIAWQQTTDEMVSRGAEGTGEELWVAKIDAGAHSAPITFQGKDGKQYVVVTATGGGFLGDRSRADTVIAYALP